MWRVAIIGCGNIAGGYDEQSNASGCQTHARACELLPDVELVAVCDRDAEKAVRFAARWGAKFSNADVHELFDRAKPNVVSICSPTSTHPDMLELCLECPGLRAVLCEKPAGFDSARLATILPRFEAAGIVFAVDYSRAYAPGIQRLRQRLVALGGCMEATVDYGKGIFSYGSHAIQWLADWLGNISNVEMTRVVRTEPAEDPNVDASFQAGTTPVRLRGGLQDRFDVEFRCVNGILRFSNYAYEADDDGVSFSTGLETVMLDVFSNLFARIEDRPSRLVEGPEALAALDVCATLAAQARNLS